ncbi:MAG: hypothetical protein NTY76_05880 [Candidatus Omnitrophica bacterium]|nr:hypothetical protein [Candidatus Omnitrophota bacterium]
MKKLIAILICLAIVVLVGMPAFAANSSDIVKKQQTSIVKVAPDIKLQGAKIGVKGAIITPIKSIDPYAVATQYLASMVNPDSYKLVGTKPMGTDTIMYVFKIPNGSVINVYVNKLTFKASIDQRIQDALTAARANAALHTGVEIGTVHVNGIEDVSNNLAGIAYRISLRVNNFDIAFMYSQKSLTTHMQPLSIVDRTTGVDVLKKAVDYLSGFLNPSDFPIASWAVSTSGNISFKFALNREQFYKPDYIILVTVNSVTGVVSTTFPKLKEWVMSANEMMKEYFNAETVHIVDMINVDGIAADGAPLFYIGYSIMGKEIGFHVNRDTGVAYFGTMGDWRCATIVLETRQNVASHMGLDDIGKVYTNDFAILYAASYEVVMSLTFRVDNYTIKMQYDYHYAGLPGWQGISLRSFIDNNTGRDYVEKAREQLGNLFNIKWGDSSKFMVKDWIIKDGELQLNIFDSTISSDIIMSVTVNLSTGYIAIDRTMVDLVMAVRNDVSKKLSTDIADVHINFIQYKYEGKAGGWNTNIYCFNISTSQFTLKYEYNRETSVTKLASCKNNANGIDLYANAVNYLHQNYGEDPNLTNWNIEKNGASVLFDFKLANGETIKIRVVIGTGEPQLIRSPGPYLNQDKLTINSPLSTKNPDSPQSPSAPIGPYLNSSPGPTASAPTVTLQPNNTEISQQKTLETQIELKGNGENYTVSGQMASAPKGAIPVQKKQ